jgi:hypothetical protein
VLVATAELLDSDVVDLSNMIMRLSLLLKLELDLIGNIELEHLAGLLRRVWNF